MRPYITCPGCTEWKKSTAHHIRPRRWYGRGQKNNHIVLICWECHCDLESYIPYRQMPDEFYPYIVKRFFSELCRKVREEKAT